jgi:hypothetical protein
MWTKQLDEHPRENVMVPVQAVVLSCPLRIPQYILFHNTIIGCIMYYEVRESNL